MQNDTQSQITTATQAASNAAAAAASAAEASKTAATNAAIAAKAAADSATTIAIVATDTSWMKKSLEGIEETLHEMSAAYVTAVQFSELKKRVDECEIASEKLGTTSTRLAVTVGIGTAILGAILGLVIQHLVK